MAGMKLSELEFLRLLPSFMRNDEAVIALSAAVDKLLGEASERIPTIRTWDKIDELNDKELDALAWELDVDWYDDTLGINEKRATIKAAQQIKRKRGTKWAVEQLITAYFGEGYVVEWYEIGDQPFTFIALTTNEAITQEDYEKFVEAADADRAGGEVRRSRPSGQKLTLADRGRVLLLGARPGSGRRYKYELQRLRV